MADATTTAHSDGGVTDSLPRRRRFTVDEYHRMAEIGILHEDDRIELMDGDILEMAAIGSRHMACVNDLTHWAVSHVGDRAIVSIQNPVRLSSGREPEPDVVLLRPRPDRYRASIPTAADVLLLVEVSDTTLGYDRDYKLARYAEAGIPEVWIFDLDSEPERVLVYRSPRDGRYHDAAIVERGGTLSPAAFPDLTLQVERILGDVT